MKNERTTTSALVEGIEVEEMTIWESVTREGHKIIRVISKHNGEIDYSDNEKMGEGDWDRCALSRNEFLCGLSDEDIKRVIEFENSCAAEQTAQEAN